MCTGIMMLSPAENLLTYKEMKSLYFLSQFHLNGRRQKINQKSKKPLKL